MSKSAKGASKTADPADALNALVAKLGKSHSGERRTPEPTCEHADAVLDGLVYAMLMWEAGESTAAEARRKLLDTYVDYNELRISYPPEVSAAMGRRSNINDERAARLCAALNEVFVRENALTLESLRDAGKREARAYLESLPGVPTFVSSRVLLLELGGHAFPVDGRIASVLTEAGVLEDGEDPETYGTKLERLVRAGEAESAYMVIEASLDADSGKSKRRKTSTSRNTAS